MAVTLDAIDVPIPTLQTSVLFAADQRSVTGTPPTSDAYLQGELSTYVEKDNRNAAATDLVARFGAGSYAVGQGLLLSIGTLLNVDVASGQAVINGMVEFTAVQSVAVSPNESRGFIWLKSDNTLVATSTKTPPAGDVLHIGSFVSNATVVTSVDQSGVMTYFDGIFSRETADTTVPQDTPSASSRFWNKTANELFYWNGTKYVQEPVDGAITLATTGGTTTLTSEQAGADLIVVTGILVSDAVLIYPVELSGRCEFINDTTGAFNVLARYDTGGIKFKVPRGTPGVLHPTGFRVYAPYSRAVSTVPPDISDGWTNDGATFDIKIDSLGGGLYLEKDENASNDAALLTRAPAFSTPYRVTVQFNSNMLTIGSSWAMGLAFYEAATGKFQTISIVRETLVVDRWTDFQNPLSTQVFTAWHSGDPIHFRIEDDGTNLDFSYSGDGENFILALTMLRTTHFTTAPDEIALFIDSVGLAFPNSAGMRLLSFVEEDLS